MKLLSLNSAYLAMALIVAASNYLVQFPINEWLTYGAFTYPASFLITELTNRLFGPKLARQVVYVGFAIAVLLSIGLATPKIALASGSAFLVSQLLDIFVFNKLRKMPWWYGPFFSSFCASIVDTAIFWSIAFYGESLPIVTWAIGDLLVKFSIDILMLTPFRLAMRRMPVPA